MDSLKRVLVAATLFAIVPVYSGTFTEKDTLFTRRSGVPVKELASFSVNNPSTSFFIKLINGPSGYDRISSATVWINGAVVFSPSDFSQQVSTLEKAILPAKENRLEVQLQSKPGGALRVIIYGLDGSAPRIVFKSPRDGDTLSQGQTEVGVDYSDSLSGVVPESLSVRLDDADRTARFAKSESSAVWFISPSEALSDGKHYFEARIVDRAGNAASRRIGILVDATPPYLKIASPQSGQSLGINTPLIKIAYADSGSGINPPSMSIRLNGTDITGSFTIGPDTAAYQVPSAQPLPEGTSGLYVVVSDRAGNRSQDSLSFSVQTAKLRALPSATPDSGLAPLTVRFKTKGESPHSTINLYRWDFQRDGVWDATVQVAQDYSFTFDKPGTYEAALEVTNMRGEKDTGIVRIRVKGAPPIALASASPTNGPAPLSVTFTGIGTKPSGYVKYHYWDLDGDGKYDTSFRVTPDSIPLISNKFESGLAGWKPGGVTGKIGLFAPTIFDLAWTTRSASVGSPPYSYYYESAELYSDTIDLTHTGMASLSYWRSMKKGGPGSYYNTNYFRFYVITSQGNWNQLEYVSNSEVQGTANFDLTPYAGQKITCYFEFYDYKYYGGSAGTFQFDDFVVRNGAGDTLFSDNGESGKHWRDPNNNGSWSQEMRGLPALAYGNAWLQPDPESFEYRNGMDSWVATPGIRLPADGSIRLNYAQYLRTADAGDGGIVEISVNGKPFVPISPVGGYSGTIANHGAGFTGNLGYSSPNFDLGAYAGDSVEVRFHFYSDSAGNSRGWLIDNFSLIQILPISPGVSNGRSTVARTFTVPGQYNSALKVLDNEGQSAVAKARSTTLEIGTPGSPSVQARISSSEGIAPLAIQFSAAASDPDGQVMLYEWDFDGDGTYDWSSATVGNTVHTFTHAGDYAPSVRVTDNDGLTSRQFFDLRVDVQASLALTESDRTFNPSASETMGIRTSISGGTEVSVFLKNQYGAIIRTLVSQKERAGGTFTDLWDGRDEDGVLVPSGPYYAILQYRVGSSTKAIDLTGTTGGSQYNPLRQQRYGFVLQPFNNIQLPLTFTIDRPAEITLFMGLLWGGDVRLRTMFNREIFGAGTYTVYWDGLTDDGRAPYEHSGDIIPGIWAYNLPDNAIWVAASPPQISAQTTTPALFAPMSEACGPTGEKGGMSLSYTLSGNAASVAMRVYNAETGALVHEQSWSGVGAGAHAVYWNGRDANNRALDESVYRIGFSSADAQGNRSLWNYNLMRTLYNHQTAEAQ